MSTHDATYSFNILDKENFERVFYFTVINAFVGMMVVALSYLIFYLFVEIGGRVGAVIGGSSGDSLLSGAVVGADVGAFAACLVGLLLILNGQAYALGWYENVRGCKLLNSV